MSFAVTLGKIVTAANENEAKELFLRRKAHGIGGVIFTPEINIPKWTDEQKEQLTECLFRTNLVSPWKSEFKPTFEWARAVGTIPEELVSISTGFNLSQNPRSIRFLNNDDLAEDAHRDLGASEGQMHLHIEGQGLMCANPVGEAPVQVRTKDADGEMINLKDFNKLVFQDRKIEIITLKEGQAIAFDDSMVHLSSNGPRFRVITFG